MNAVILNFALADNVTDTSASEPNNTAVTENAKETENSSTGTPFELEGATINTENLEEGIENIANKSESLAYKIVQQISDKSLPVCSILILWGSVLYFILGIRNLYKKRQGLLLMWGAFTFVVIAKIMNFAFWFAFVR